jgi:hypothetical protein
MAFKKLGLRKPIIDTTKVLVREPSLSWLFFLRAVKIVIAKFR